MKIYVPTFAVFFNAGRKMNEPAKSKQSNETALRFGGSQDGQILFLGIRSASICAGSQF